MESVESVSYTHLLDLVFSGQKDIDTALKDAQANGEKAMEEARNN